MCGLTMLFGFSSQCSSMRHYYTNNVGLPGLLSSLSLYSCQFLFSLERVGFFALFFVDNQSEPFCLRCEVELPFLGLLTAFGGLLTMNLGTLKRIFLCVRWNTVNGTEMERFILCSLDRNCTWCLPRCCWSDIEHAEYFPFAATTSCTTGIRINISLLRT